LAKRIRVSIRKSRADAWVKQLDMPTLPNLLHLYESAIHELEALGDPRRRWASAPDGASPFRGDRSARCPERRLDTRSPVATFTRSSPSRIMYVNVRTQFEPADVAGLDSMRRDPPTPDICRADWHYFSHGESSREISTHPDGC
jgi:hypothetical protein